MKKLLCPKIPASKHWIQLDTVEAHHAIRVMRLRDGQPVQVIDGKGKAATVTLRIRGEEAFIERMDFPSPSLPSASPVEKPLPITLEMAILKADAMEWVIEKAVELNIQTLTPLVTDHTVIQIRDKGPDFFRDRWQKIADQALKQCGRLTRLEIQLPVKLEDCLKENTGIRIWCDEGQKETAPLLSQWLIQQSPSPHSLSVLLGPEGGWSQNEREWLMNVSVKNAHAPGNAPGQIQPISLGPLVLRAETAAICAMSLISGITFYSRPA